MNIRRPSFGSCSSNMPIIDSPYAYLGLWRNPFGELTAAERSELAVVDTEPLIAHLTNPRGVVQFVGDCGYGKTTHLLAIRRQLSAAPLVYFPPTGPRPPLPPDRPLLVDEAQRMGWRRRRALLASPGPLVIATHVDLSPSLRRAGFEVLSVDVAAPKEPVQLVDILNRRVLASRISASRDAGGVGARAAGVPSVDEPLAAWLIDQFESNLRRIESFLYEDLQACIRERRPWPRATYRSS